MKITRFFIFTIAALANPTFTKAENIVLDCSFDQENGTKGNYSYFSGKLINSPLKIDPEEGSAKFYRLRDGGGLFIGGGDWTQLYDSPHLEASQNSYILRAREELQGMAGTNTTMVISRTSGKVHIKTTYWDIGKTNDYTGVCAPGKDPETIPAPKAIL